MILNPNLLSACRNSSIQVQSVGVADKIHTVYITVHWIVTRDRNGQAFRIGIRSKVSESASNATTDTSSGCFRDTKLKINAKHVAPYIFYLAYLMLNQWFESSHDP